MPGSFNCMYTQSYCYKLTPFMQFMHTLSCGSYHHPFPGFGGSLGASSSFRRCGCPSFLCLPAAPRIPLTHSHCVAPWVVTLHLEVGSLHAAPPLPPHCFVLLAAGEQGKGQGVWEMLPRGTNPLWWLSLPFQCLSLCHTCPFSLCISLQVESFFVIPLLFNAADDYL